MQECDQVNNMDDYDANAEWMYVLSLPLINMTLTDPTAVNTVDSCIDCMSHVEIVSNKIDLSFQYVKCQEKNGTIKWMMDSGASMAFTSTVSDFSELIYFAKGKQLLVHTANGTALVLGFGTVFIQTYLPQMIEHLLSMG